MASACEHLSHPKISKTKTHVCEECVKMGDQWVHLRLCMECGHVGCCDSSKNKHATRHFHTTKHPSSVQLSRANHGRGVMWMRWRVSLAVLLDFLNVIQFIEEISDVKKRQFHQSIVHQPFSKISAQPRLHQRGPEIQRYGTVNQIPPLDLEEPVRLESTESLKQLLADTSTLRDLYKKSHWQVWTNFLSASSALR